MSVPALRSGWPQRRCSSARNQAMPRSSIRNARRARLRVAREPWSRKMRVISAHKRGGLLRADEHVERRGRPIAAGALLAADQHVEAVDLLRRPARG